MIWPFERAEKKELAQAASAAPSSPPPVSLMLPESERVSSVSPLLESGGRVMITNGGPHPAERWAQGTAEHIIQIPSSIVGERLIAAQEFRQRVQRALVPHHAGVQQNEREKLLADIEHLLKPLDPEPFLDAVLREVQDAAKGTEWEAAFAEPDRLAAIRHEIAIHFRTVQHIERSWHADARPDHPVVKLWCGR